MHHLENLPESALAKEVYNIQTKYGLPGMFSECQEFLVKFELFDLKQFSKNQFKVIVKKKIRDLNKEKILDQAERKQY